MRPGGCVDLADAFDQPGFLHRPDLIQHDLTRFPLESNRHAGGVGTALGVMGATMTVSIWWFILSGEMIRQGRVLRISRPSVGSRRTRKTSNREATTSSLSDPTETSMAHHDP